MIATLIDEYINAQAGTKQVDLQRLHATILSIRPACKLWFLDGKDENGKIVCNPNIGYGTQELELAGGKSKEFYKVGLSGNTQGISVYFMGLKDKNYLTQTLSGTIGKAKVSSYCIKFKKLSEINFDVLLEAIQHGLT